MRICEFSRVSSLRGVLLSRSRPITKSTTPSHSEKARLARDPIRKPRRTPRRAQSITMASSVIGPSDQRRVVIDGVTFEFDKDGQRLKRVGGEGAGVFFAACVQMRDTDFNRSEAIDLETHIDTSTSTPTSFSMSGQQYLRTKRGNFVSAESVRRRRSSGDLSGFGKGNYARYVRFLFFTALSVS
jgi:hypothetical protein